MVLGHDDQGSGKREERDGARGSEVDIESRRHRVRRTHLHIAKIASSATVLEMTLEWIIKEFHTKSNMKR